MLKQADIDKFYEDLESLRLVKPVAVMAEASGLSTGNVSEYLAGKKKPSERLIKAFYEKVYKPSTKAPPTEGDNSHGFTIRAIASLAESNKKLADAHLELAEANKILAIGNRELIDRLPRTDPNSDIPLAIQERFSEILEKIAEVGSGKRWNSTAEGIEELNKLVIAPR